MSLAVAILASIALQGGADVVKLSDGTILRCIAITDFVHGGAWDLQGKPVKLDEPTASFLKSWGAPRPGSIEKSIERNREWQRQFLFTIDKPGPAPPIVTFESGNWSSPVSFGNSAPGRSKWIVIVGKNVDADSKVRAKFGIGERPWKAVSTYTGSNLGALKAGRKLNCTVTEEPATEYSPVRTLLVVKPPEDVWRMERRALGFDKDGKPVGDSLESTVMLGCIFKTDKFYFDAPLSRMGRVEVQARPWRWTRFEGPGRATAVGGKSLS